MITLYTDNFFDIITCMCNTCLLVAFMKIKMSKIGSFSRPTFSLNHSTCFKSNWVSRLRFKSITAAMVIALKNKISFSSKFCLKNIRVQKA